MAGFIEQRTAFTDAQNAILLDLSKSTFYFARRMGAENNLSMKLKTDPVTLLFLMKKHSQQQKRNACAKFKKDLWSGVFFKS